MQAHELIQIHGFKKAFDVAAEEKNLDAIREIQKIEKRMFGTYRNAMLPTSGFSTCANPLRLDTYGHCPYGCSYCFAGNNHNQVVINADAKKITGNLESVLLGKNTTSRLSLFSEMVKLKWPIHIGGRNDPMPPQEARKRVLFNVLLKLQEYQYPCIVSTKSILPLQHSDYLDIFADMKNQLIFQMSLITTKQGKLEKFAPSPKKRIELLEKLSSMGVNCVVRLQPFFMALMKEQKELFGIYSDIGVKSVIVEGLKIKRNNNRVKLDLIRDYGIEINKELTNFRYSKLCHSADSKHNFHKELRDMAHSYNLTYLVADDDFRFMGDSPNCCGTDLINAKTNDYNITSLSYYNHNDFGFHLMRNQSNEYLRHLATCISNDLSKKTIYDAARYLFNSSKKQYDSYEYIYSDTEGDRHYRIKPEYLT